MGHSFAEITHEINHKSATMVAELQRRKGKKIYIASVVALMARAVTPQGKRMITKTH